MRLVLLGVLVLDALLLAVVELLFLPLRVGGWPFPVSALVALVTTPWLVRATARQVEGGPVAGAPLAAWLVTVLVFGTAGPGGDVLLPADWRSLLLLASGTFPAAVAVGRSLRS
jgi:hypothetical protein